MPARRLRAAVPACRGLHERALEALHESVIVCRDLGDRPSLAATLDWSHGVLAQVGRPEPAATFVGALTGGTLAEVGDFPLVGTARTRTLRRARAAVGDDTTNTLVAGAAMTYDEIVEYALHHLEPACPPARPTQIGAPNAQVLAVSPPISALPRSCCGTAANRPR